MAQSIAPFGIRWMTWKSLATEPAHEPTMTQVLKGGPGSGRYPKGSGGHPKPAPKGVLHSMLQPDGGFTYNVLSGHQPKVGFALSIHPDRGEVVDAKDTNVVALAKYTAKNWDLLSKKGNYLGGWHNPDDGRVYLDVSTVVKTAEEADKLSREAKQLAYFDLVKGVSIKTLPGVGIPYYKGPAKEETVNVQPLGLRKPKGIGRVDEPVSGEHRYQLRQEKIRRFRNKHRRGSL